MTKLDRLIPQILKILNIKKICIIYLNDLGYWYNRDMQKLEVNLNFYNVY